MKPSKKVEFIEKASKSLLGLEGLQIVVYCDRNRFGVLSEAEKERCTFLEIGNKILTEIDGEYIKKKYNIQDGVQFGKRLHEERIRFIETVN